jgi:hypothetical protein
MNLPVDSGRSVIDSHYDPHSSIIAALHDQRRSNPGMYHLFFVVIVTYTDSLRVPRHSAAFARMSGNDEFVWYHRVPGGDGGDNQDYNYED